MVDILPDFSFQSLKLLLASASGPEAIPGRGLVTGNISGWSS